MPVKQLNGWETHYLELCVIITPASASQNWCRRSGTLFAEWTQALLLCPSLEPGFLRATQGLHTKRGKRERWCSVLPTSPLSKSLSGLYSLHHHLLYPGPFGLFSRLQPKRAFKMQILLGHFSVQNPLGISYYSKDQIQTFTSDPPSSFSTKPYLPREPGFHITHSTQAPCSTFEFLNPFRI